MVWYSRVEGDGGGSGGDGTRLNRFQLFICIFKRFSKEERTTRDHFRILKH